MHRSARMRRAALRVWLLLVSVSACVTLAPKEQTKLVWRDDLGGAAVGDLPPDSLRSHPSRPDPWGPQEAGRLADPNQRPVYIRAVGDASRVHALYVVGHAESKCCHRVSTIVDEGADIRGLDDRWFSFGVAHLSAHDPEAQAKLAQIVRRLGEAARTEDCVGQVNLATRLGDEVAILREDIATSSAQVAALARSLERPVLVWQELPAETFTMVPLMRSSSDAPPRPLSFELDASMFSFPPEVYQSVSLAGLGQYIASLRSDIEWFQRFLALAERTAEFTQLGIQTKSVWLSYDPSDSATRQEYSSQIKENLGRFERLADDLRKVLRLAQERPDWLSPAWIDDARARYSEAFGWVSMNRAALKAMAVPPKNQLRKLVTVYWKEFSRFIKSPGRSQRLSKEATRELAHRRSALQEALALHENPPSDPLLALADAALRGWPATFSDSKAEELFDRWQLVNQRKVWNAVQAQLRGLGIRTGSEQDPLVGLRASNLLFRIERRNQKLVVQPVYVLSGPLYIVADPEAGLVRFESAAADQNLKPRPETP